MVRNSKDKLIGGVIGGFATWLGVNSSFLRVVFIILFRLTIIFYQIIFYSIGNVLTRERKILIGYWKVRY